MHVKYIDHFPVKPILKLYKTIFHIRNFSYICYIANGIRTTCTNSVILFIMFINKIHLHLFW